MPEHLLVELTPVECRALRMGAIFGGPTPPSPVLDSAVAKLRAAESLNALRNTTNLEGDQDA
jgi:hypothetical protein